jgi:hypothetical protein
MKKEVIKLKESDLEKIAKRIIRESNSQGKAFGMGFTGEFNPEYMEESDEETDRYEKGKYGVRASRSRADYEPTPRETEIVEKLFGKYSDDIPPIVVRYLRKLGRRTLKNRLLDLNLI